MRPSILTLLIVAVAATTTLAMPNKKEKQIWKALKSSVKVQSRANRGVPSQAQNAANNPLATMPSPVQSTANRGVQSPAQNPAANANANANAMSPQRVANNLLASLQAPAWRPPLQIVGGQDAALGEFPYQVSIRSQQRHQCGGTLIAANFVLTSGFCVKNLVAPNLSVVAGTVFLSSTGGQTIPVIEIIVHPDLDEALIRNDIALLRLGSSVRCNDVVQIIELEGAAMSGGEAAVAIGWGLTSFPSTTSESDLLQYVDADIITNEECLRGVLPSAQKYVHESTLCTSGVVGKGVCFGDGGDPLVVQGKQVGIASWIKPCAQGYPDAFTRITSFLAWISSILQSGSCGGGGCRCGGGGGCGCGCGK